MPRLQPAAVLQQSTNDFVCSNGTSNDHQLNNHETAAPLSEFWSENPPSSASSGFSDDDSLAGAEGDPKTIEQIVQMVKERGRQGLINEYADIRSRAPDGTFVNAKLRNNLIKNRYTDVLCYDHSRVILSKEEEDPSSDYINANFVDGYKQKNAYISTQGESEYLLSYLIKKVLQIEVPWSFIRPAFPFQDFKLHFPLGRKILKKNNSFRSITKDIIRFLAYDMGTTLSSDSYDN